MAPGASRRSPRCSPETESAVGARSTAWRRAANRPPGAPPAQQAVRATPRLAARPRPPSRASRPSKRRGRRSSRCADSTRVVTHRSTRPQGESCELPRTSRILYIPQQGGEVPRILPTSCRATNPATTRCAEKSQVTSVLIRDSQPSCSRHQPSRRPKRQRRLPQVICRGRAR